MYDKHGLNDSNTLLSTGKMKPPFTNINSPQHSNQFQMTGGMKMGFEMASKFKTTGESIDMARFSGTQLQPNPTNASIAF